MLIIISAGLYHYIGGAQKNRISLAVQSKKQDVAPGGNKAILTLADGSKISLDEAKNGNVAEQAGTRITKATEGRIIYLPDASESAASVTGFNTIETPAGGQYQVQLPDGTGVWLNASSSLRYPVRFSGKTRTVEITGEAYFEVAHNADIPFIVSSAKQEVKVLGTHFNIMAYPDENMVKTTLLEGSVKVTAGKSELLLRPGQQSEANANEVRLNKDADTDIAVAWRYGKIQFMDSDIRSIMRMLSRWYNVEVEFTGGPIVNNFGGSVSRSKNLSEVLKVLEATGDVHFKISC